MERQAKPFIYRNFVIDKSKSLGRGSYGTVYKASCDELPCAVKILHPIIVDTLDPGATKIMERFERECMFLKDMRHPNIVQCLGVSWDTESNLPALFMELMDESLTAMLERSQHPLSYHVQVDLCHDISLALAYLHSNGIIHRDLSGNNVLVMAGRRAKVTDFGMVKLAESSSPGSALPGTDVYMPPEALQDPPLNTRKLDCFSEGVIIIQVCTRLYPKPAPRTQRKPAVQPLKSPDGSVEVPVLETERRKNHIDLIEPDNPLLLVAIDCLSYNEDRRPSATELCRRMAELKKESKYTESLVDGNRTEDPDQRVHELQQRLREQQRLNLELQQRNNELQRKLDSLEPSTPGQTTKVAFNWGEEHSAAPYKMVRGAAVVDEGIAYFMNTTGDICSYNSMSNEWSVLPTCPLFGSSLAVVNDRVTAVGGEYLSSTKPSHRLISLEMKDDKMEWVVQEELDPMPTARSFPAVVCIRNNLIVAGGKKGRQYGQTYFNTVEIMNTESGKWCSAARLPYPYSRMSVTVCRDTIYMLGGFGLMGRVRSVISCSVDALVESQSWGNWVRNGVVFRPVWQQLSKISSYHFATCITIRDELYAIGGCSTKDESIHTNIIQKFNRITKSWEYFCEMPRSVERCLAVVLPTNELMVVGGGVYAQQDQGSSSISIAKIIN